MPLFMDRHEVPDASPEDVATAHASDLAVAPRHGVEFFSYWFDPDKGGVFCFAKAPSKTALQTVHEESHGILPHEIISVTEDNVLRFLGSVRDPVDPSEITSPVRTVLFTDLEGSTALVEEVGEAAFIPILEEHDTIIRRALLARRGREVKHTGDGFMAAFDRFGDALRGAIEIRDGFEQRNPDASRPLRVRLGMASGQPVDHNEDMYGSAVNLAARLCAAAQPGHILVSEDLREQGVGEGFGFGPRHEIELKGFDGSIPVYELVSSAD